jgi:hypothetical protein
MMGAVRRSKTAAAFVPAVSIENGTSQTPQRDSFAFVNENLNGVRLPTIGAWPTYDEVDPEELRIIQEGLRAAPELMWIAGVAADRLWALHSLKVFNWDVIDEQVMGFIDQWARNPGVEAARRIIIRCLREDVRHAAYEKARLVYFPALVKRIRAIGVELIPFNMIQRPRNYGPDTVVGLDEIADKVGVVKTSTLIRSFVRSELPLAHRGGEFVTTTAVIRVRPERSRKVIILTEEDRPIITKRIVIDPFQQMAVCAALGTVPKFLSGIYLPAFAIAPKPVALPAPAELPAMTSGTPWAVIKDTTKPVASKGSACASAEAWLRRAA